MYELRDSSWFDRGTGFCKGVYDDHQDLALIIVESEEAEAKAGEESDGPGGFLKEELLLSARVEKDDIYARQQGGWSFLFDSHKTSRCRYPQYSQPIKVCALELYFKLFPRYARIGRHADTADTLIVWTEPLTNLDIALSFQDADGCDDIWQFICEVQRHLNNLPSEWISG